jgi:hypothetical protein
MMIRVTLLVYEFNIDFIFILCNQTNICILSSSICIFIIVVNFRMTYPRSKHVALLDTKYSCSLYSNVYTNKQCKLILKLLRHVSVLIHHLQGVYSCAS